MRIVTILLLLAFLWPPTFSAFDHNYTGYAEVLKRYVRDGLVDYRSLKKDRRALDQFVKEISGVQQDLYKSWNRNQKLAFWINAYNGWFLQIVIDHYPIERKRLLAAHYPKNSVQQIPGIWEDIKIGVAGRTVSLNTIEHEILRPQFREPRIHFAIVCASVGCPELRTEPFLPDRLEQQLKLAAEDFVVNPKKVKLDQQRKILFVSKIFDWFADDFSGQNGVIRFLSDYLPRADAEFLKKQKVEIKYLDYDWSLNERT